MRDTVDKILNNEAGRLLTKSQQTGLQGTDLAFLNQLIAVHNTFLGEPTPVPETAPEQSSTEALLDDIAKMQVPIAKPAPVPAQPPIEVSDEPTAS